MFQVCLLFTVISVKAVAPEDGESQNQTDYEKGQTYADVRAEGLAIVSLVKNIFKYVIC